MASASESQESAAPLRSLDVMRGWGIADVARWTASLTGLTSAHADILLKNEVTGADLLDGVSIEGLHAVGMLLGPAVRIMAALAAIKIAAAPASGDLTRVISVRATDPHLSPTCTAQMTRRNHGRLWCMLARRTQRQMVGLSASAV